jgi:hypothetical protein
MLDKSLGDAVLRIVRKRDSFRRDMDGTGALPCVVNDDGS